MQGIYRLYRMVGWGRLAAGLYACRSLVRRLGQGRGYAERRSSPLRAPDASGGPIRVQVDGRRRWIDLL